MAIKLVREPSAVPNIKNSDDARLFRYAVGNQEGFVKNVGLECSYTIDGSIFRVMPGEIVLQGYDIVIDGNNAYISIDNIATKRYYSVYVELNLMTQKAELKQLFDTAGYPNLPTSDDLTSNTYGTANLELYRFTATNGVISEVSKVIKIIDYNVCPNLPQTDRSERTANTEYVRQAISDVPSNMAEILKKKAEFYEGTNSDFSDYPIGSIILAEDRAHPKKLNTLLYVRIFGTDDMSFAAENEIIKGYTFLKGKWAYRGRCTDSVSASTFTYLLLQRIV